jgi:hypothetical protein
MLSNVLASLALQPQHNLLRGFSLTLQNHPSSQKLHQITPKGLKTLTGCYKPQQITETNH